MVDLLELDEFRRAASECSGLAAKAADLDKKASFQHLAWSYENLAENLRIWADMVAEERVILDAARADLVDAADDPVAPLPRSRPHFRVVAGAEKSLIASILLRTHGGSPRSQNP
jgi:hypothetical protein